MAFSLYSSDNVILYKHFSLIEKRDTARYLFGRVRCGSFLLVSISYSLHNDNVDPLCYD